MHRFLRTYTGSFVNSVHAVDVCVGILHGRTVATACSEALLKAIAKVVVDTKLPGPLG